MFSSGPTSAPSTAAAPVAATAPTANAADVSAQQRRQLGASDILAVVTNNTLVHGPFTEYYAADGTIEGRTNNGARYTGSWSINENDNTVCTSLPEFGAEGCAEVYATSNNQLTFVGPDGRSTELSVNRGDQVTGVS